MIKMAPKNEKTYRNVPVNTKTKPSDLLFLSVLIFFTLFVERILNRLIRGFFYDRIPLGNLGWTLVLRGLCCLAWGFFVVFFLRCARKNCQFDLLKSGEPLTKWHYLLSVLLAVAFVVYNIVDNIVQKSYNFSRYGDVWSNIVGNVSAYLFYAFDAAIVFLVIALAQNAFDLWMKKNEAGSKLLLYIPFGGVVLGLLQSAVNLMTGGGWLSVLVLLCMDLIFGVVYVAAGKKTTLAFPLLLLMFLSV